jgi:ribonuclease-3
LPIYTIQKQSGPQHSPIFKVEVKIKNSRKYYASGTSKKDAQQNAAQKLISDLKI